MKQAKSFSFGTYISVIVVLIVIAGISRGYQEIRGIFGHFQNKKVVSPFENHMDSLIGSEEFNEEIKDIYGNNLLINEERITYGDYDATILVRYFADQDYDRNTPLYKKINEVVIIAKPDFLISDEGIELSLNVSKLLNHVVSEKQVREISLDFYNKTNTSSCSETTTDYGTFQYNIGCDFYMKRVSYSLAINVFDKEVEKIAEKYNEIKKYEAIK